MASSARPSRFRAPTLLSAAAAAGSLVLWVAASFANPVNSQLQQFLNLAWLPALLLTVLMLGLAFGSVALLRSDGSPPGDRVEPLLPRPALPPGRRRQPIVSIHGLETSAGSTTVCFSLGALLAAEGTVIADPGARRPRPVCLLQAGRLSARLDLDPEPLSDYLARNPLSIGEEIVTLAQRHPTGCELLCISEGALHGQRLRLLVPILRKHYDAILLDCPVGDRWLTEVAMDLSELVVAIGLPTRRSASTATAWVDEAWRRGFEGRSAVVVNRVGPDETVPEALVGGFIYHAQLPDDTSVSAADAHALPWSLAFNSSAARHLREAARQVFADFLRSETINAA
jgi:MinD-like ATPase involved in chromosome partitioning or flagellar assembly